MKPRHKKDWIVVPRAVFRFGDRVFDPREIEVSPEDDLSPEDKRSERAILRDLERAKVSAESFDDIVNLRAPVPAVPVLLRHLGNKHSLLIKTKITIALQTKAIRDVWPEVVKAFRRCRSRLNGEDFAVAIFCGAGKDQADDIADLCRRKACPGREVLLEWLRRKKYAGLADLLRSLRAAE